VLLVGAQEKISKNKAEHKAILAAEKTLGSLGPKNIAIKQLQQRGPYCQQNIAMQQ